MWGTTEQILWALRDQKQKPYECHSADGQAQLSDVLFIVFVLALFLKWQSLSLTPNLFARS